MDPACGFSAFKSIIKKWNYSLFALNTARCFPATRNFKIALNRAPQNRQLSRLLNKWFLLIHIDLDLFFEARFNHKCWSLCLISSANLWFNYTESQKPHLVFILSLIAGLNVRSECCGRRNVDISWLFPNFFLKKNTKMITITFHSKLPSSLACDLYNIPWMKDTWNSRHKVTSLALIEDYVCTISFLSFWWKLIACLSVISHGDGALIKGFVSTGRKCSWIPLNKIAAH